MSTRAYPLPRPDDNTLRRGLAYDVARCLESLGMPRFTLDDIAELRTLLHGFLYAPDATPAELVLGDADEDFEFYPMSADELLDGLEKARAEEDRIAGELAVSRLDEDQPLAARGHVQVDIHGIPALGAASLARLLNGAPDETELEQPR